MNIKKQLRNLVRFFAWVVLCAGSIGAFVQPIGWFVHPDMSYIIYSALTLVVALGLPITILYMVKKESNDSSNSLSVPKNQTKSIVIVIVILGVVGLLLGGI